MSRFKTVAVMGTGTMGPGMGAVLARAGMAARLYDTSAEQLEKARAMYDIAWGVLDRLETPDKGGGSVAYVERRRRGARRRRRGHRGGAREARPQEAGLRRVRAPRRARGPAGLEHVGHPHHEDRRGPRSIPSESSGTHWSNPPHLIPMIEVIPGEQTSADTLAAATAMVEDVGYLPSRLKKEVPGFVENRVLYAIMRECLALVDAGVIDREELDTNVKWGIGYKLAVIPPMQLLDMAGLDIYTAVASYLNQDLSNEQGISSTIAALTAEGRLGHEDEGRHLRLHRRADRRAARAALRRARQGAQGPQQLAGQGREEAVAMKIYLLDLGSLVIDRSDVLWHIDVGTPVRFPVYGVYIDHPEGKFVFDTGYDLEHVNKVLPFELPEQTPEQTLPAQLAKCGVTPEEIDYVVNSHFHFDHVGGNRHLTNATLLTSKLRAALGARARSRSSGSATPT